MNLSESFGSISDLFRLPEEKRVVSLLLFLYFFLALAAVVLVKSLQNAAYLVNLGFDWRLPSLYLALALLSGPLVLLYRYLAKNFSHLLIASTTLLVLGGGLAFFWLLFDTVGPWAYFGFYFWSSIFSVLVPTQGWIFSYHLFDSRMARRVFVVLSMGGVLGGVAGGVYTALAAERFGTGGLFLQVFLILAVLQGVLLAVNFYRPKPGAADASASVTAGRETKDSLRNLFQSKHVTYLAAVILLTGLSTTLVDLQYKWSLTYRFPNAEAEFTEFFGGLLGITFLLSFLLQLLGTSQVLKRFGLGVGLALLPIGLMAGALGMIATARFWSVVMAKVLDGSLRSSVEQTSVELLYVPISDRQNISIKNLMELVVFRVGDGIGAALFLVVITLTPTPMRVVGVLLLLSALLWLLATRRITEEYALMLRRSLEYVGSKAVRRALQMDEAMAEKVLITALRSSNPKQVFFALQQLQMQEADVEISPVTSSDWSGEIITMDMSTIYPRRTRRPAWISEVEPLIEREDPEVKALALHLLTTYDVGNYRHWLHRQMRSEEVPDRALLLYLSKYADDIDELIDPAYAEVWCQAATGHEVEMLAPVLGRTRDPAYRPMVLRWLEQEERRIRKGALLALGEFGRTEDIPTLVEHLSAHWSRDAARRGLSKYGDAVVEELLRLLRDLQIEVAKKREIPYILTQIDSRKSREVLVAALYNNDSIVAYRALKGLNKIRTDSDLSYSSETFLPLMQVWSKEYYGLLNIDLLLHTSQKEASLLLRKAIKERLNWSIEKIFRGLDLFLPHGDAYFSYLGFTSSKQELRENAIELIDSRIRGELRHTLLPIFSELHPFDVVKKGREVFKLPAEPEAALSEVFFHGDPWLKCCTIVAIAAEGMEDLKVHVEQARDEINPLVRETAEWALDRWGRESLMPE